MIIKRGDTKHFFADVYLGDAPYVLTGLKVWFTAKLLPTDSDGSAAIHKSTVAGGVTIINCPKTAVANRAKIVIDPADTANLPAAVQYLDYDVQVKGPGGEIYTVAEGKLQIEPDVTQAVS